MDRNETNEVAAIDVNHQVGAIDLNRPRRFGEPPLPIGQRLRTVFKSLMLPSLKMIRFPWPWTSAVSMNQGRRANS